MRTGLSPGLLLLGILVAAPALGQAPRLGPIVPCEATSVLVEPGLMPQLTPASLPPVRDAQPDVAIPRPSFGVPRPADERTRPSPGRMRLASRQSPAPDVIEDIPTMPTPLPQGSSPEVSAAAPSLIVEDGGPWTAPAAPMSRFWLSPELLYWQVRGQQVPPLVTAAPAGARLPTAGTLGNPGTAVVYGGGRVNDPWRIGVRLSAGWWFDPSQCSGIQASVFFLDHDSDTFRAGFNGNPGIFRPFFNGTGAPNAQLIAFQDPTIAPGRLTPVIAGQVLVHTGNSIQGEDVNYRHVLRMTENGRIDVLLGYRHLGATDDVSVSDSLVATNVNPPVGFPPPGTLIFVRDSFQTTNTFNGGQLGLTGEQWRGPWFLNWTGKLGLGNTHRVATIDGLTQVYPSTGGNTTFAGGLLAQGSNIGRHTSDAFSAVPELGINVGRQLTPRLRVFAGYTFLYWTNVWRAGEQIDLVLNQVPPVAASGHPAFPASNSSIWVQGVSVGAELRY
jgi:hypothetical protein